MMKLEKFLLVACSAVVFSGCATSNGGATTAASSAEKGSNTSFFENQSLENSAQDVLSKYYPKGNFSVVAYDDNVLLLGQIPTQADKDDATTRIKALPKVANVWNYLEVGKNEGIGQSTTDAYLTTAAKSRLVAQKDVNTDNIKVVTENGTVYLLGKNAGNSVQVNGAATGIKSIDGVKAVVNLIAE